MPYYLLSRFRPRCTQEFPAGSPMSPQRRRTASRGIPATMPVSCLAGECQSRYAGTTERKTEIRDDLLHLETREGLGKALVATHDIAPGTRLGAYGGREGLVVSSPTMHTVQLSESAHTNAFGGMEFASHCCRPNCILHPLFSGEAKSSSNVIGLALIANKWIHAGASSRGPNPQMGSGKEISRSAQQSIFVMSAITQANL